MLMTEQEAKEQVCPLIRYCVNELAVSQDGDPAIYVHQNCQGSACKVGWRWEKGGTHYHYSRGFCGAFGRPEA